MKAHRAIWKVSTQCRVLGVSTSGFHAWYKRTPSQRDIADDELTGIMLAIYAFSREAYGRPRVPAELRDHGIFVRREREQRLMYEYGLVGASRTFW